MSTKGEARKKTEPQSTSTGTENNTLSQIFQIIPRDLKSGKDACAGGG